jgi:Holliday junction resolvase
MSRQRGIHRERQVRDLLLADGWWVVRAAGSLGDADLVALKDGHRSQLVEVKSTAAGPYHGFGPSDREQLTAAAVLAGADATLCWWPPRRKPIWLHSSVWPEARGRSNGTESRDTRGHDTR